MQAGPPYACGATTRPQRAAARPADCASPARAGPSARASLFVEPVSLVEPVSPVELATADASPGGGAYAGRAAGTTHQGRDASENATSCRNGQHIAIASTSPLPAHRHCQYIVFAGTPPLPEHRPLRVRPNWRAIDAIARLSLQSLLTFSGLCFYVFFIVGTFC